MQQLGIMRADKDNNSILIK